MTERQIYFDNWSSFEDMVRDFADLPWRERETALEKELQKPEWQGLDVLFAVYDTPPYEGEAFVLLKKDGNLYEVNGSHCSCYGLEGQWTLEDTTKEAILHRMTEGYGIVKEYAEQIKAALEEVCNTASKT